MKQDDQVDIIRMHTNMRPEEELLDDGTGTVEAWIVSDGKLVVDLDVPEGRFYSEECYILLYTYQKKNALRYHIYFWQGAHTRKQDRGMAALLVKDIVGVVRKKGGSEPSQENISQFKEPAQFYQIFKGRSVVLLGRKTRSKTTINLYQIRNAGDELRSRIIHIPNDVQLLNSSEVFALTTPKHKFIWFGSGVSTAGCNWAKMLASSIPGFSGDSITEVKENEEPKKFWKDLGGKASYANFPFLQKQSFVARLFCCSNISGKMKVEEVYDFCQEDLSESNAYILDAQSELYVWLGKQVPEDVKKRSMETGQEYVRAAFDGRLQTTPIYAVSSGQEPFSFRCVFPQWIQMQSMQTTPKTSFRASILFKGKKHEGRVDLIEELLKEYDRTYTFAELTGSNRPKGLDSTKLETYLSDEEFKTHFGVQKEDYAMMPRWKREKIKKDLGLY